MKHLAATFALVCLGLPACAAGVDPADPSASVDGDGRYDDGSSWASQPVPVSPANAENFFTLADGTNLLDFDRDHMLKRNRGIGTAFGPNEQRDYEAWKTSPDIRWIVTDLDTGDVIAESDNSAENVSGASTAKAVAVGALLWHHGGQLDADTWHRVIRLIAKSDNAEWAPIEALAGGSDGISEFSEVMGYESMRAMRRENRINVRDMATFLFHMHNRYFDGAEALLKIMAANQWAYYRSQTYLPTSVFVGGKTGTYGINNNEAAYLEIDGHRYGVCVFSTAGGSNSRPVAVMFGGLAREYLGVE